MNYAAMIVTALVGASLAVQIGLNATMSQHVGSPIVAALINFAVGTLV
ncbi:MAG: putative inner rane exporter, YdcZ, partial [Steroidobacteraceae bacterium]|nr:putative inner rane exporter, YdcZ [Steroidobacteraceae bacterium]